MRIKLIVWCLASTLTLGCGFSLAAAPVEEAHEYIPAADQEDSTGEDAAQPIEAKQPSHGFSLAKLPRAKWHDYSNDSSPQKVHVALAEGLGPARDSTTINMSEEQRLLYVSQQVDKLMKLDIPGVINELQQEVAQLKGQLQSQERAIKTLQSQQQSLYQNMNTQIKQLQNQITTPNNSGQVLNNGSMPNNKQSSEPAPVNKSLTQASVSSPKRSDTEVYQAAFSRLMNKQYSSAQQGFNSYLRDYPNGKYSGNVNYWLGEIALIQKRYPQAETAFSEVVNHYQKSGKLVDASYKLAITHLKMGKSNLAKTELLAIEKQNAGRTVARLAKLQLQQMG